MKLYPIFLIPNRKALVESWQAKYIPEMIGQKGLRYMQIFLCCIELLLFLDFKYVTFRLVLLPDIKIEYRCWAFFQLLQALYYYSVFCGSTIEPHIKP